MEQPPAPCAEAQEALSPPGAGAGVDTFTNASNPETPSKGIPRLPRKKKKQKKTKQKGELVLWMKGVGGCNSKSPPLPCHAHRSWSHTQSENRGSGQL